MIAATLLLTLAVTLPDAARDQNPNLVRQLIQQKAAINEANAEGQTALYWAAHWSDLPTVEVLLKAGADPNKTTRYGLTPLYEAAVLGDPGTTAALLKAGANANTAVPLIPAARTGNLETVRHLLDH